MVNEMREGRMWVSALETMVSVLGYRKSTLFIDRCLWISADELIEELNELMNSCSGVAAVRER